MFLGDWEKFIGAENKNATVNPLRYFCCFNILCMFI